MVSLLGKNVWQYGHPDEALTDRTIPTWIVGASGTGKSTLLESLVLGDMEEGGLTFLDPHGSSVGALLHAIPKHRVNDVIFLSPLSDRPVGFNPLSEIAPQFQSLVASQMVSIFSAQWGSGFMARAQGLLKMAIAALLTLPNATLLHVEYLLTEPQFQRQILSYIKDPLVYKFWATTFPHWNPTYKNDAIEPILNKLRSFLSPDIRATLCQKPKMDIRTMIERKQILLCDLSVGQLGETESTILGALLFGKIFWTMMALKHQTHYLYYDEAAASNDLMASALSQARKHGLGLILANQYITQYDKSVRDSLMANTNKIVFRCSADDAAILQRDFPKYVSAEHITDLNNYECFAKFGTTYSKLKTYPPFAGYYSKTKERVLRASASRFGQKRVG